MYVLIFFVSIKYTQKKGKRQQKRNLLHIKILIRFKLTSLNLIKFFIIIMNKEV